LIAVQARHHDVHEDQVGGVVGDLGEGVEAVLRQHHLASGLGEKDLGAAADGVAVIDDHDLDSAEIHLGPPGSVPMSLRTCIVVVPGAP
jgi:hypothetical protein